MFRLHSFLRPALLSGLSLFPLFVAFATETALVGAISLSVPAGKKAAVGFPFQPARTRVGDLGTITAVGPGYFEDTRAAWPAGAFSSASSPYFVRITSGLYAGTLFRVSSDANTATRVYVYPDANGVTPDSGALGLEAGDTFEIVPGSTLLSLFGTGTLRGGASAGVSDTVSVWGGGAFMVFYYNTTRNRWERDTDTAASPGRNDYVLSPDSGLLIQNRGTSALPVTLMGQVSVNDTPVRLQQPGTTLVPLNTPVDTTLGDLGIQKPGCTFDWVGATDPTLAVSKADLVQIWNGAAWDSYYYDTARLRWQKIRDASNTSADAVVIKAGSAIFVRRVNAASAPQNRVMFIHRPRAS